MEAVHKLFCVDNAHQLVLTATQTLVLGGSVSQVSGKKPFPNFSLEAERYLLKTSMINVRITGVIK